VGIIGTLWPDYYTTYTTYTTLLAAPAKADSRAREREVLALADVVRIAAEFTPDEQDRARAAAARDPGPAAGGRDGRDWVRADPGPGSSAAASRPVGGARTAHPYAWAVLTAALDAARLGARAPLSAEFLRAAAPGYCTSRQQAEAPKDDWFEQALTYAVAKLHGGAAALSPAGGGMGFTSGYEADDYLIQHAGRERRYARLPASTWDAFVSHVHDPSDAARLADSAKDRLRYRYAIPLFRRAADARDIKAAKMLTQLLDQQGRTDELRARADNGDQHAAHALLDALKCQGNADGLRALADACSPHAAQWLPRLEVDLIFARGDADGLRARADGGDWDAAWRLVDLFFARGDVDGLRARADAGDGIAQSRLPALMAQCSDDERGHGPTPATRRQPSTYGSWTWTAHGRLPTRATRMESPCWTICWSSAVISTNCTVGSTPVTGSRPNNWRTFTRNKAEPKTRSCCAISA